MTLVVGKSSYARLGDGTGKSTDTGDAFVRTVSSNLLTRERLLMKYVVCGGLDWLGNLISSC